MKILYISPENTVGTLDLWKEAHQEKGNQCDFVTLYETKQNYNAGICLKLPLIKTNLGYLTCRHFYYKLFRGEGGDYQEKKGNPPAWKPNSYIEKLYFKFRDWVWHFYIEPAIEKYGLMDYDIYHFDWGLDLYRDCRFAKRIAKLGKPIVCTYHGQDMRTRGVIPEMDSLSQLNLTSELDLLQKHPNINYLFLPVDTNRFSPDYNVTNKIRICHSPTNRYYKGSETIIPICERIALENKKVEFILIENESYDDTLSIKQSCDILVDQVHNRGGWGYGMNSVESLAMGLVCMTELVEPYKKFIPDHPFIHITAETFETSLRKLISDPLALIEKKKESKQWVEKYHGFKSVSFALYDYYKVNKWI